MSSMLTVSVSSGQEVEAGAAAWAASLKPGGVLSVLQTWRSVFKTIFVIRTRVSSNSRKTHETWKVFNRSCVLFLF